MGCIDARKSIFNMQYFHSALAKSAVIYRWKSLNLNLPTRSPNVGWGEGVTPSHTRVFSKGIWLLGQAFPVSFVSEFGLYARWCSQTSRMNIKKSVLASISTIDMLSLLLLSILIYLSLFTKENEKGLHLTWFIGIKILIFPSLLGQGDGSTRASVSPVSTFKIPCPTPPH